VPQEVEVLSILTLHRRTLISVFTSVAFVLVIFQLGCTTSEPEQMIFDLSIQNETLKAPSTLIVKQNDDVIFDITSDKKTRFHLHGYNLDTYIEPNTVSTLSFKANATGKFDFEIHLEAHIDTHSHDHEENDVNKIQLGSLEVHPR
jgi:heme/copper-type cytochrome/quinol oxidase subunit 2